MLKFRKKNIVSVLVFTGVISPNMGRRKGLNVQDYDKSIEQAFQNKNVKAVALLINSPGGSPVQSDFLAKRIVELSNEKNIPVISSIPKLRETERWPGGLLKVTAIVTNASVIGLTRVLHRSMEANMPRYIEFW